MYRKLPNPPKKNIDNTWFRIKKHSDKETKSYLLKVMQMIQEGLVTYPHNRGETIKSLKKAYSALKEMIDVIEEEVKQEFEDKHQLKMFSDERVHFFEEWMNIYEDWDVHVYSECNRYFKLGEVSFNRHVKRSTLERLVSKFIHKADHTFYAEEELQNLDKIQLWMMFRKYKPVTFGEGIDQL